MVLRRFLSTPWFSLLVLLTACAGVAGARAYRPVSTWEQSEFDRADRKALAEGPTYIAGQREDDKLYDVVEKYIASTKAWAEERLFRSAGRDGRTVRCFHGNSQG
jgi:hypothetical protein